ncbi:MAG: transcription elongation factor GreA [Alphaproteobacteria bacterium]|nr:transcription elongation factor GreA [Alphaproteobacteria bacterium]
MNDKFPITVSGFATMQEELRQLKTDERPAVIKAIAEAREHGDLSENAEYHAAREKQSMIEGRISLLEDRISRAEVIDVSTLSGKVVMFGAYVTLVDEADDSEVTWQIIGEYEADISNGQISVTSPIARALIGKEEGEMIEVQTPKGKRGYEIIKVAYK